MDNLFNHSSPKMPKHLLGIIAAGSVMVLLAVVIISQRSGFNFFGSHLRGDLASDNVYYPTPLTPCTPEEFAALPFCSNVTKACGDPECNSRRFCCDAPLPHTLGIITVTCPGRMPNGSACSEGGCCISGVCEANKCVAFCAELDEACSNTLRCCDEQATCNFTNQFGGICGSSSSSST